MKKFTLCAVALLLAGSVVKQAAALEPQKGGRQGRSLVGHVLDSHDEPIDKAIVYLKNTKTLVVRTYISEPDGSYRFPGLSPYVDYEVYAESNGAHSDTKTLSAFDTRREFNITLRIKAR